MSASNALREHREGAPPAFHLLAKPTGAVCNLDCSYCFFLSKEMLYPGSRFRMADDLLETYLRQLIEAHARVPEVTIAWQGGEPTLMGVEFFRRSVERVAEAEPDGSVPWSSWRDRPLYVQDGDVVTGRSVTAEQYGRFLIDVFEEWVRRDVGTVYVQMFDVALANWVGEPPSLCVHSETCGLALALEHTGDLYSCDHFVEPKHKLGNIRMTHMLELVDSPQQRQFGLDKRETLPQYCLDCDVRFACHGGCPKDRFIETPDGEPGLNYLCAGFKAFFHHVDGPMRTMGALLGQGRAPAEIMGMYASDDGKRARNEPCTCGSGRKWKNCHGGPVRPAQLSARA